MKGALETHNMYSMHHPQQAWRSSPGTSASLPQRPKLQPPVKGTFSSGVYVDARAPQTVYLATPPQSSPYPQRNTVTTQKPVSNGPDPTQYTFDDGPRSEPGTGAYYKSWAFRQKVNEGKVIKAMQEDEVGEQFDDSADEDYITKRKSILNRESLVMVFSRTNVRRASTQRKVNERMQRSNRRM